MDGLCAGPTDPGRVARVVDAVADAGSPLRHEASRCLASALHAAMDGGA